MTKNDKNGIPQVRLGPIGSLNPTLRASIEKAVSEHSRQKWKIRIEKDFSEFACHQSAILSDGLFAVFFKYGNKAIAKQQFEAELADLKILSELAGVLIPRPIGIVQVENGWLLIMEALDSIRRGPQQWRQIGSTLARIHRIKGNFYGFKTNGFCGPLFQDNTPAQDWVTFFRERRLLPRLKAAIESGNLPHAMADNAEKIAARVPELCGPATSPCLLHGDAQQNNFISCANGTYVIDPAVYYGNPEADLALIDSFQPVPEDVFEGYRDEMPIDPGFYERRNLWRIPLYLAAIAIEGAMHLDRLDKALKPYI